MTESVQTVPPVGDTQELPQEASASAETHPNHLVFPTFLEAGSSLLKITVVALFVLTFMAQPFRIPSESMERTLLVGDFLLVNKVMYAPGGLWHRLLPYQEIRRGDVVVFHFPLEPAQPLVKRVVGLPGDRIRMQGGRLFINGNLVAEPYVVYEGSYSDPIHDQFPLTFYSDPGIDTRWWVEMRERVSQGELVIPPDEYFVMGDNRNHSRDSRYWGFVPRKNMMGHPFLVYFSLREPSATDDQAAADDRLGHDKSLLNAVQGFARWNRMFHVVR